MRYRLTFAATIVAVCSFCATVLAQPSGSFGGGFRGGSGGGRFDPREMLRRMDANQNGILEQNELSDRSRYFIDRMAERSGLDPKKPIPLDKLFGAMDRRRQDDDQRRREDRERREQESKPKDDKVPDFGIDQELALVPDFSLPADSPLLSTVPLEERYNGRVLDRAERTLREYDRNKDGVIDQEELSRARWSSDPQQSDLNGDGKLNKVELCERYVKWYGSSSGDSNDRSRSSSSGGSSDSRKGEGSSSSSRSRFDIDRYARSLLQQYDTNKNGTLEREEWSKMRSSHHSADRNRDGKIKLEELAANLKAQYDGKQSSSSSRGSRSSRSSDYGDYKLTTLSERLAALGISSSSLLVRNDKNRDGQLQMHEFASSWDDARLAEFDRYDANRDGVITPQEWLAAEKGG